MFKDNKRTLIITSIATILPIFIGIFLWNQLPNTMAVHFDANGDPNGYSGKFFAVFGLPFICLAIHWFGVFITAHDPKKQNINPKMFKVVMWAVPIISLFIAATMYSYNLGHAINIDFAAKLFVAVMLIIFGNYLPKARQNYTIGIKLPWTLADEANWNKTHRFSGYLWIACGIIMALLTLAGLMKSSIMIIIVTIIVIVPFIYSYLLHTKKQ